LPTFGDPRQQAAPDDGREDADQRGDETGEDQHELVLRRVRSRLQLNKPDDQQYGPDQYGHHGYVQHGHLWQTYPNGI